ncbi:hypothetical protein Cadr_000010237 [Camelus dromedarius]|uniref:Uncharacterized protein n=1 Tax=Camelus dromedarius TaxID=9838 RepID=A0A5N4DX47_CAMDR|nr:hypothetical protein Cadr_000010237 [Camelus dromedarius]
MGFSGSILQSEDSWTLTPHSPCPPWEGSLASSFSKLGCLAGEKRCWQISVFQVPSDCGPEGLELVHRLLLAPQPTLGSSLGIWCRIP